MILLHTQKPGFVRYFLCSCIIICLSCYCQAQQNSIDSLEHKLKSPASDSEAVNLLYLLAKKTSTSAPAKSSEYAERHLQLAKKIKDKHEMANAYSNLGIACDLQGNYEKALEYYQQALSLN